MKKEILEIALWKIANAIRNLKENECENSGLNWYDEFCEILEKEKQQNEIQKRKVS